jgi:phospholipid/cholesterol/gamma-HCH transport system permease protein
MDAFILSSKSSEMEKVNPSFATFFTSFVEELFASVARDRVLSRGDIRRVIARQVRFTGQQALRLVAVAATFVGMMTVAQSAAQLQRFGGSQALGPLLVAAIFRELGPLLTALIVISRSVSAVASELSSMKANGEIEMLKASGISPLSYLVFPRVAGGALALTFLTMHFVWIALAVGFGVAQFFVVLPWNRFLVDLLNALGPVDILIFLVKTLGTGFVVFSLACFYGLRISGRHYEIPQATTQAVVASFLMAFGLQICLSVFYYMSLAQRWGLGGLM